jgi:hypothetical protein
LIATVHPLCQFAVLVREIAQDRTALNISLLMTRTHIHENNRLVPAFSIRYIDAIIADGSENIETGPFHIPYELTGCTAPSER